MSDITVIIPTKNDLVYLKQTFEKLLTQTYKPKKIIIVDSSNNDHIERFVTSKFNKDIEIYFKKLNFAYPGKARNVGSFYCKTKYIAFLDSKTQPDVNWLHDCLKKIKNDQTKICFGTTKFYSSLNFQKIIQSATVGNRLYETTPGSVLENEIFVKNYFIENVLAGEDIEWRKRLQKKYKISILNKNILNYENLPKNLYEIIYKYYLYSYHSAYVNIQNLQKKIYLILNIILLYLFYLSINTNSIQYLYIYAFFIFLTSFLFRGIFNPLLRNVSIKYIFPFRWLYIGLIGFTLDLFKTPGYLLGSILPKYLKARPYYKEIVFFTKYGENSASYRYRIKAYKKYLILQGYKIKTDYLFDSSFFKNKIYFNKLNYFKIVYSYIRRLLFILSLNKSSIAIVHVELLPLFPLLAERILKYKKIKYIIDIDDAVYHRFANSKFKLLGKVYLNKFIKMSEKSDAIFAGNDYHKKFFYKYNTNSFYIPTVLNLDLIKKKSSDKKFDNFTVVWIGSPSTSIYLNEIKDVINDLAEKHHIQFLTIGANPNDIKDLNCNKLDWSTDSEYQILSKCHVGIMPLKNTLWEMGKCGFKILQYMSVKIPVIASPYGINSQIIKDGENGFTAVNKDEWIKKILILKNDNLVYKKLQINGYDTVYKNFNFETLKLKLSKIINEINIK